MKNKVIALVDCNSFYASCEQVFKPNLRGKPVVVLSNNDGCVVARSKEAKKIGIPMGAAAFEFKEFFIKNGVHVFSSNYTLYGDMSRRVMEILREYSPNVEEYSIDEAFVDLTDIHIKDIKGYALEIREKIFQWTGIPVSIGIAHTKTLAKIANHVSKKFDSFTGILDFTTLEKELVDKYLELIPINDVWGVGRQYAEFLTRLGVRNARQMKYFDIKVVKERMTVMGERLIRELNDVHCIDIEAVPSPKKGIASTRSFKYDVTTYTEMCEAIAKYTSRGAEKLRKQKSVAQYIQIFILTNRFKSNLPQYSNNAIARIHNPTSYTPILTKYALYCLQHIYKPGYHYKKAGVILTGIQPESTVQFDIFTGDQDIQRDFEVNHMKHIDKINAKYGRGTIKLATEGIEQKWYMRQDQKSQRYTTSWFELLSVK